MQTQSLNNFEIGHKVTWSVGKQERPIICEGLFIEKINDSISRVKVLLKNKLVCITNVEVQTSLLTLVK